MSRFIAPRLLAASIALTLAACGPSEDERRQAMEQQAAQAAEAQAAEQYALYEAARESGHWEVALSHAEFIRQTYPDASVAAQLDATYDEVSEQAASIRETRRLEGLWVYHAVEEDGAMSRTAYVYSEAPDRGVSPVRLVLRAHPEWGDSVYLLPEGETPRFSCANPCEVQVRFDDADARDFEAVVSEPTENHAMFIDDFDAFVAGMDAASRVLVTTQTEDGDGVELAYEVGGFDLARFESEGEVAEAVE
jgi:hypothetical protein